MSRGFRTLSNRIFLGSAALAVSTILAAVWLITRSVTAQTETEIARGLTEAATSVDEYRRLAVSQLVKSAQLVADLPKFKAAVELDDPPTVAPLADDYRARLGADVFVVLGRSGRVLAQPGSAAGVDWTARPAAGAGAAAPEPLRTSLSPQPDAILQLVTVPVWIDPAAPSVLGTLIVGVALDSRFAAQIKRFTDSDVVFAWDGRVRAGTLPASSVGNLERWLASPDRGRVELGGDDYSAILQPLQGTAVPATAEPGGTAAVGGQLVVLRSRTERLRPLQALHRALGAIALAAVLLATLLSYFVARTVTRPVRAITARMREMASSGDLTRAPGLETASMSGDEDAIVLANTFNTMTESLARFQREAAQRERLSSLGRLSTVIAHEIRNPLMIIKSALRSVKRTPGIEPSVASAVADIDEEVVRLNRLVNGVLDFARPIRFTVGPASLNTLCIEAVAGTADGDADGDEGACALSLDAGADDIHTDAERLRQVLVNVLTNARQSVAERAARDAGRPDAAPAVERRRAPITLRTLAVAPDRVRIVVADRGTGLDPQSASRVFDPFFTTKTTGTGIGLAISRNIVEGLGGTITLSSQAGAGTQVAIELPRRPAPTVEQTR